MAILVVSSAKEQFEKSLFKKLTTIGSDLNADIVLDDPLLPPVVAHIQQQGNQYTFVATHPKIGARVKQSPIQRYALQDHDVVFLGDYTFQFLQDSSVRVTNTTSTNQQKELKAYQQFLSFSKKIAEETDIRSLISVLMDEVISLTNAEKGFLVLLENNEPRIQTARNQKCESITHGIDELSDSILQKVLQTKQPIVVSDATHDAEFSSSLSVINFKLTSVMCVPLVHRGNLFGAIYVGNNSFINVFDEASLEILTIFAGQASLLVQNALDINALTEQTKNLKANLEYSKFGDIIGTCSSMQTVFRSIDKIAQTDVSVLIMGETGTGKELIARELHRRSQRSGGPFIVINCGAIPENLLESELFGHIRGAFTGATNTRIGKFQAAHTGTLFLDEIGEMPLHLQVKILRALQEHRITKVGDTKSEEIDIRIVAATHRDLKAMARENSFREDLYYRLNVIQIDVPPLRERGNDVLVIANYLLQKYAKLYNKSILGLTEQAQNALLNYSWPGNVRQLENRIKRAIVMCDDGYVSPADIDLSAESLETVLPLNDAIERFKQRYIREALERNAGNRTKTARELGVDPRTIFRHLESERRSDESQAV